MRSIRFTAVYLYVALGLALALDPGTAFAGTKWAIVVGINEYQRKDITPLNFGVADARLVADALRDDGGFPADNIFILTSDQSGDSSPTSTNVAYRLGWLADRVKPDDTVVVYFSCHGMQTEHGWFVLTVEADPRNVISLEKTALSTSDLQRPLKEMKAQNVLIIVDACRNDPKAGKGGADNRFTDAAARDLTIGKRTVKVPARSPVSATLFSCSQGERSYEWFEKGHGFFSYFLVKGLHGEAASRSGGVTLANLEEYLHREVPKASDRWASNVQTPWMSCEGSPSSFVVSLRGRSTDSSSQPEGDAPRPAVGYHPPPQRSRETVVSARGQAGYRTVADALRATPAGGRIRVMPGVYNESVQLDKDVEIVGDGAAGEVCLDSTGTCITMRTDRAAVRNLTLKSRFPPDYRPWLGTVLVERGELTLRDCDVSGTHCGILTLNSGITALERCRVHGGGQAGVMVYQRGQARVTNCDIYDNGWGGVQLCYEGNAVVKGCRIYDGRQAGVFVYFNSSGLFEDCEIRNNQWEGVHVQKGGHPVLRSCRIYANVRSGVAVDPEASIQIDRSELSANGAAGIQVDQSASAEVTDSSLMRNSRGPALVDPRASFKAHGNRQ